MELNALVFPAPAPSYTHETVNNGTFMEKLEDMGELLRRGNNTWIVKAKMLYVPKFEVHTEKNTKSLYEAKNMGV